MIVGWLHDVRGRPIQAATPREVAAARETELPPPADWAPLLDRLYSVELLGMAARAASRACSSCSYSVRVSGPPTPSKLAEVLGLAEAAAEAGFRVDRGHTHSQGDASVVVLTVWW